MTKIWWLTCLILALALARPNAAGAEQLLRVDATAQPTPVSQGFLHMGTAVTRNGDALRINSQYLELDGKPWLPVMGEFHYARVPEQEWNAELLKMKASGVDIVSTYVFWNYHEPRPGEFIWSGDRDLRRFVKLCAKDGLDVLVRIGPWSHGEVRFGGLPDWVVHAMPTRRNDPTYLHYVKQFYTQIADQLKGLWWKDDGPVIGVQIENEYNLDGPGQGAAHIATLKRMARAVGMDVPLYTVTGWDGALFPPHEVVPVFGGYPDQPWSRSTKRLPPNETYAFRFDSRVSGADLGAQTKGSSKGDADADAAHTPFLGAEFGGGVPAMYRRRVVIAPADIASMLPVELGSGVNLYGYYMYQGGRNLVGPTTLEESTLTGGYNDTPIVSYDFQAPLGQYGQEHPVLGYIRPFHYFLQAFGSRLAPMAVHAPAMQPRSPSDLQTPRFSVRSKGESGFVFLNNHVRQYAMAAQKQVRFAIQLPAGELTFPRRPIDIPTDAYFIWPFHFDMDGVDLLYATAQPMTRLRHGHDVTYVFVATDGITPEFAFDPAAHLLASQGTVTRGHDAITVNDLKPSTSPVITLRAPNGLKVHVLILSQAQARQAWLQKVDGKRRLILTPDSLYFDRDTIRLTSIDNPRFKIAIYPAPTHTLHASLPLQRASDDGVFAEYRATARARHFDVKSTLLRRALPVPPVRIGGGAHAAMEPLPETFGDSAAWTITLPSHLLDGLRNVYLNFNYQGDVARLFSGTKLLDDNYANGQAWPVGLRRFSSELGRPLTLTILPLRSDSPIYIQDVKRRPGDAEKQVAHLLQVQLLPAYGLDISPNPGGAP